MIVNDLSTLKIHQLSQAQYDRELEAGNLDDNAIYLTPDDGVEIATPDWNQNDETAPDYIKNRPFYEINDSVETVLFPETTVIIDAEFIQLESIQQLQAGQTYTVIFNGVTYECVAREWPAEGAVLIGNGTIYGDHNPANGEPFCFDSYESGEIYLNTATPGDYTFSISSVATEKTIHHIDPKYIKDMYYEKESMVEILEETEVRTARYGEYDKPFTYMLVENETYTVKWNGIEYTCIAKNNGYNEIYIGNQLFKKDWSFPEQVESSEPFFIYTYANNNYSYIEGELNDDTTVILEILHGSEVVVPEATISMNFQGNYCWSLYNIEPSFLLQDEKQYIILFNGNEYKCTAWSAYESQFLGNGSIVDIGYNDTTPFLIDSFELEELGPQCNLYTAEPGTYTISITEYNKEINQIDDKYLPEGKTGRDVMGFKSLLPESEITYEFQNSGFDGAMFLSDPVALIKGETYIVTWDATEYECVCYTSAAGLSLGSAEVGGAGNVDNGEPFFIALFDRTIVISAEAGSHTFSIVGKTIIPQQIDPKYLPDGIGYGDELLIVDNLTYEDYDDGDYPPCTFIVGEKYTVTIDDNIYSDIKCGKIDGWRVLTGTLVDGTDFYINDNGGNDLDIWIENEWSTISIIQGSIHKIDKKYLPDNIESVQPDWNQTDESALDFIKNKPETSMVLKDIKTGLDYVIQIIDGTLISTRKLQSATVTSLPNKIEYIAGEIFDPTGMVITGTYADGTTKEIADLYYPEVITNDFKIYCIDGGVYVDNINDIFSITNIIDFEYTINEDGMCALTEWKETLNGEPSTELIIPDNAKLIL